MAVVKMRLCSLLAVCAIALAGTTQAVAAVIPTGVQLHATQEMVRNNGGEPETLDPALIESVGAVQIASDLFEGLTATTTAGDTVPLTEATKRIMDDYPIIPLLQYAQPRLARSTIGGYYESNSKANYRSKDFYIIKH